MMDKFIRTDVTAVKFYKHYILAGIGSSINVFQKKSTTLLQRLETLYGQKIYGIVSSKYHEKILIFGGKQFTLVSPKSFLFERVFEPVVCDDWIHSAIWVDANVVALLTAHNVVQKWDTLTHTLISCYHSRNNSILYSGLLLQLNDDILVMAGTVFSDVIIHRCGNEKPLHNLKGHKGVIFSISCKLENNIIVTTSDDRSVRIWGPNDHCTLHGSTVEYWEAINIVCKHEVYGHTARVMKCCITTDLIVSVGEDSAICYWDYRGKLLKKAIHHQNSAIWSVDTDDCSLVTGGGDCAVIIHPLKIATDYCFHDAINIDLDTPKNVVFTARRNIAVLNASELIFYNFETKIKTAHKLNHESTYKMLSLSSCKQLIAICDMNGKLDVFSENCKDEAVISRIIDKVLHIGKILSMHWAGNRHIILCSDNGSINILTYSNLNIEIYSTFVLPTCKERWLTASSIESTNKLFIVGDRCGNVHVYMKGQKDPIKSFNKVHGRYGPTSITVRNNEIVTTGRDGTIKYFSVNNNDVKYMSARDLEFQWVEKFLDKIENMVCGFQERVFVVYNLRDNSKIVEALCGGGHRSWDVIRYFEKNNCDYEEFIKLMYLKNYDINITTFKLKNIRSYNIINGSHSKEINCLKIFKTDTTTFYISGSEDTTLRISSVDANNKFQNDVIFKHLSTVKTLKTHYLNENCILLISAGGRAQICVREMHINSDMKLKSAELIDYLIKGTDKERKGNQTWRNCSMDLDPEMRIMDIDVISDIDNIVIIAGCSDAYLRVFTFKPDSKKLEVIAETKYHSTCILKTNVIKISNRNILATCTTRGVISFWDVIGLIKCTKLEPFFSVSINKSGINSFVSTNLSNNRVLIGTGGDDNTISLILLEHSDRNNINSLRLLNIWSSDKYHSSQITGLCITDRYLLSVSIDQRVTLFEWSVKEGVIKCDYLSQAYTDVADVQGMDLMDHDSDTIKVCVFGKGIEVICVRKPQL